MPDLAEHHQTRREGFPALDSPIDDLVARISRPILDKILRTSELRIDGREPWDPQVRHPRFYRRVLLEGTLGAGESYVDGDWECSALDGLAARIVRTNALSRLQLRLPDITARVRELVANRQSPARAAKNGKAHYDLGNELYEAMLGPSMVYSCGYWRTATTLDQAQEAKLDLICKKLKLDRGSRLLDIGCGWGSLARYAAERYGVSVVGITVSPAQAEYARQACAQAQVDIRLQDYRDLRDVAERFDAVVSVGMFEHVGARNYDRYMKTVADCLAPGGLFLLHTIGSRNPNRTSDAWIDKHVFPGGNVPSMSQIAAAAEPYFVIEDCHNFGADYDRTLTAWWHNFDQAWPALRHRYDERFYRMWRYYLLTCAGAFRARDNQLWQVVLSRDGRDGGYERCPG